MPVYKLLGGPVRDKVVCYPHNEGKTYEALLESCQKTVAEGWKFVRFGMPESGGELYSDFPSKGGVALLEPLDSMRITEDLVGRLRQALGPEIQILLDVHTRLDSAHVIQLCRALEPYRPFFIEDPIRSENPGSYRKLARHINLPIAAGEQWPAKYEMPSLRLLGTVGEPINPEAWRWYHVNAGKERCPIVDTWWQTETGGILISPLPGATPTKPGSATFPFFGIEPVLLEPCLLYTSPSPRDRG